jgi:hypothetical protein
LVCGSITAIPYIYFLLFASLPSSDKTVKPLTDIWRPLRFLSMPFATQIPPAALTGGLGLVLCLVGIAFLFRYRKKTFVVVGATPALMIAAYSLLGIAQLSVFRSAFAPWYNFFGILFWIGLLGLCVALWQAPTSKRGHVFITLFSVCTLGVLSWAYISTNFSHRQYQLKSFFLHLRDPASASCVRNYRVSPTFCVDKFVPAPTSYAEYLLSFYWLERYHLSPFGPHQKWMLQGDFVLDSVRIEEHAGVPDVRWSADRSLAFVNWSDYRHLNLVLHTPNAIEWTITLPEHVQQADFHTALAISTSAEETLEADGTTFEISAYPAGASVSEREILLHQYLNAHHHEWLPVHIPLERYVGQTITLRLTSYSGENTDQDWAMYRFPFIDVHMDVDHADAGPPVLVHQRTFPPTTTHDLVFNVTDGSKWATTDMDLLTATKGITSAWLLGSQPALHYQETLHARLSDYSHMLVRVGPTGHALHPQGMHVLVSTNYGRQAVVRFVLFSDDTMHTYSYDLKLLELEQGEYLETISITFHQIFQQSTEGFQMQFADVRLVHKEQKANSHVSSGLSTIFGYRQPAQSN